MCTHRCKREDEDEGEEDVFGCGDLEKKIRRKKKKKKNARARFWFEFAERERERMTTSRRVVLRKGPPSGRIFVSAFLVVACFSACFLYWTMVLEEAPSSSSSSSGGVGRDRSADEEDEDVKRVVAPISFAFLMYGQARTLNRTHCGVYENIVKPILDRKHRVHFFIRAEADEDAWQFEAFAEEIKKRRREEEEEKRRRNNDGERGEDDPSPPRLRYTLEIETGPEPSEKCVEMFSKKYEKRADRIARGPKGSYPRELLTQLMYREASSELMYAEKSHFDVVMLLRPDVEYGNEIPADFYTRSSSFFKSDSLQMKTVHAPAWSPFGGVNDRLMVSRVGEAAKHYLSLYSGLCGGKNNFEEGVVHELPNRRKGLNAERIYAWWMKEKGGYSVSTKLLANFVFYRVRRDETLEDGPDRKLGRQFWLWNPSRSKWSDTLRRHYACTPLR